MNQRIATATVVLLRNTSGSLETLMLRKNSEIAFGGMWVFPGGRVDDGDRIDTTGTALDDVQAARNAAVREAHEEAAIRLNPESLVLFAHWLAPTTAPRPYTTWFFAVRVDDRRANEGAVDIDQEEIVEGEWMTPEMCMQRHNEGEIELAPPTWVTLARLRNHHSAQGALAHLKTRPPRYHATRFANSESGPVAMWAGDAGYDTQDATLKGPRHRLEMFNDGFRYVDTLE